jgi:NAD(P)-dependent dehydrogenase (short-subunit alcohol dehydrogenase family)
VWEDNVAEVVVVTGIGGMGAACARRLGSGRELVVVDIDAALLAHEADALALEGFSVTAVEADVADRVAVDRLVATVRDLGTLRTLVHTAAYGPSSGQSGMRVLEVALMGTEYLLVGFAPLAVPGSVAVCIASNGGYLAALPPEFDRALITAETDELLAVAAPADEFEPGTGYTVGKRGAQLRVERYAAAWGANGGRVVSISPGVTMTPMGRREMELGPPEVMQAQETLPAIKRLGTPHDIANAVAWLAGPEAALVTGCDLRADGGLVAAVHAMGIDLSAAAE